MGANFKNSPKHEEGKKADSLRKKSRARTFKF